MSYKYVASVGKNQALIIAMVARALDKRVDFELFSLIPAYGEATDWCMMFSADVGGAVVRNIVGKGVAVSRERA